MEDNNTNLRLSSGYPTPTDIASIDTPQKKYIRIFKNEDALIKEYGEDPDLTQMPKFIHLVNGGNMWTNPLATSKRVVVRVHSCAYFDVSVAIDSCDYIAIDGDSNIFSVDKVQIMPTYVGSEDAYYNCSYDKESSHTLVYELKPDTNVLPYKFCWNGLINEIIEMPNDITIENGAFGCCAPSEVAGKEKITDINPNGLVAISCK